MSLSLRTWFCALGWLLLPTLVVRCTKFGGNAEGFGGGDPRLSVAFTARNQLEAALNQIAEGYALDTLCKMTPGAPGVDPVISTTLSGLTAIQITTCQNFIKTNLPRLQAMVSSPNFVGFGVSDTRLTVTFADGSLRSVAAITPFGPEGPIVIDGQRLAGFSEQALLVLLGHEFSHKIFVDQVSGYVTDNDPYVGFTQPGGGRALLDSVGAALAFYYQNFTAPNNVNRSGATSVWTGNTGNPATANRMLVYGGRNLVTLSTGLVFDPALNRWTAMSVGPLVSRTHSAVIWTGREMIVWGGNSGRSYYNDGAIYDPATDRWRPMSATGAPSARAFSNNANTMVGGSPMAVWTGTQMIIWGGVTYDSASQENIPLNTGAIYTLATDSWSTMTLTNAPVARTGPALIWTGNTTKPATTNRLVVWGGTDNDNFFFNDGYYYNPANDRWTAMPPVVAATRAGGTEAPEENPFRPLPRRNPSVVYTGSTGDTRTAYRLIIWSGNYGDPTRSNDGAIFDFLTQTWREMAVANAPALNQNSATVWTGSRMMVWGGNRVGADTHYNSGAIYDLALDTWTPMGETVVGNERLLAPRQDCAAVWTGATGDSATSNRLIISGGSAAASTYFHDGAMYDPSQGNWTPIR